MVEPQQLILAKEHVRLDPGGLGFAARSGCKMFGPRLLLADPLAISGTFTDKTIGSVGHFIRYVGVACAKFGGSKSGPVYWNEPYLVWIISDHHEGRPIVPKGWRRIVRNLRSDSGMLVIVPLHNPMKDVVREVKRVCDAGLGCQVRLPVGHCTVYYQQNDSPPKVDSNRFRDVVICCNPKKEKPIPPKGPWIVEIDLAKVRTQEQFFDSVGKALLLQRRKPPARFWNCLHNTLNNHIGKKTLKMIGWAQFEKRQPELSTHWRDQVNILQTAGELSDLFVEYDSPPSGPAIPTRRLQVLLAKGTDLTLPALAAKLGETRPSLEILETKKQLDITSGKCQMHVSFLKDCDRLKEIRDVVFVDQFVEHDPDRDIKEIAAAPKVLDIWTNDASPRKGQSAKLWRIVTDTIRNDFKKAYLTEEEYESLD